MLNKGYGIMPNIVLYAKDLTDKQKILFVMISSLCAEKGYCRASNKFFADKLGNNDTWISKQISDMSKKGYIEVTVDRDKGNARAIVLQNKTYCSTEQDPSCPTEQDNNTTSSNSTNNTSSKEDGKIQPSYGNLEINDIIKEIKEIVSESGLVYDSTKDREFTKHLLSKKFKQEITDPINKKLGEEITQKQSIILIFNVLCNKPSINGKENWWYKKVTGPMKLYQNKANIVNNILSLY